MSHMPDFFFVWTDYGVITRHAPEPYLDLWSYCTSLTIPLSLALSGGTRDDLRKDETVAATCRAVFILSSQMHAPLLQPLLTAVRRLGKTTIVLQDTKRVDRELLAVDAHIIPFQDKDALRRNGNALSAIIATGIFPDEPAAYTASMLLALPASARPSGWFVAERSIAFGDRWRLAITEIKPLLVFSILAGLVLAVIIRALVIWRFHSASSILGLILIACCAAGVTGASWLWLLVQSYPPDVVIAGPRGYVIRRGGEVRKHDYRQIRAITTTSSRTRIHLDVTNHRGTVQRHHLPRQWRAAAAFVQRVIADWQAQLPPAPPLTTPAPPPPAPTVVISFVAADRGLARRITTLLRQRGVTADAVLIGTPLPAASAVCLLIISSASRSHPQIDSVAQMLHQRGIPIIPLAFVTHQALPGRLQPLQWVDFSGAWQHGWRELALALTAYVPTTHFDVDAILERYTRGVIPPTWRVSREPPTRLTFAGVLLFGSMIALILGSLGIAILYSPPPPFTGMITSWHDSVRELLIFSQFIGILGGLALLCALIWAAQHLLQGHFRQRLTIILPNGFVYRWGRRITALAFPQINGIEKPANAVGAENYFFVASDGRRYPVPNVAVLDTYQRFVTAANAEESDVSPRTTRQFVFISHARKDASLIDQVDRELQGCGIETWVDRRRLQGGQEWPAELQEAIATCSALLVVVTPRALASAIIQQEYRAALAAGKPVIASIARPVKSHDIPADLRACLLTTHLTMSVAPVIVACNDLGLGPNCFDDASVQANPKTSARLLLARLATRALPADTQVLRRPMDGAIPLRASLLTMAAFVVVAIGASALHLKANLFLGVGLLLLAVYCGRVIVWLGWMMQREIAVVAADLLLVCQPSIASLDAYPYRNGILIDSKGDVIRDRTVRRLTNLHRFGNVQALTQMLTAAYERYQARHDTQDTQSH